VLMHSNQRPAGMLHRHLNRMVDKYPCRECDVSFKTCDEFTSHLRRVHNDFRFVCHICAKMFKLKGSLLVHQRVVHQSPEGEGHHCTGRIDFLNYYWLWPFNIFCILLIYHVSCAWSINSYNTIQNRKF
jgi:hypothetical protein